MTPTDKLNAAADWLAMHPVRIQRTEAGATDDITEPLAALLETLAVQARLFPGAEIGERLACAILDEATS